MPSPQSDALRARMEAGSEPVTALAEEAVQLAAHWEAKADEYLVLLREAQQQADEAVEIARQAVRNGRTIAQASGVLRPRLPGEVAH